MRLHAAPAGFIALSLLGCSSTPKVTRPNTEAPAIVQTVAKACKPLCLKDATAPEVGRVIGRITSDLGGAMQLYVKPNDATFSEAEVFRDGTTRRAVAVWFTVAEQPEFPVAQFTSFFGGLQKPVRDVPNGAVSAVVDRAIEVNETCQCRLTAEVRPGGLGLSDGSVTKITLRRAER
jgi:hypothetical protein